MRVTRVFSCCAAVWQPVRKWVRYVKGASQVRGSMLIQADAGCQVRPIAGLAQRFFCGLALAGWGQFKVYSNNQANNNQYQNNKQTDKGKTRQ